MRYFVFGFCPMLMGVGFMMLLAGYTDLEFGRDKTNLLLIAVGVLLAILGFSGMLLV